MQAIILAAGMGKRLGGLTQGNTKCMIQVNGETLIDRMMDQLSAASLNKIVIVVGYCGDQLKKYIGESYNGTQVEYVNNPIYDKTNNIYSLYLAKDYLLEDDTILLESDLIFDNTVLGKVIDSEYSDLALVAKYEPWMDGTMVTLDDADNIISFVPKKLFDYSQIDKYYKTVNIYKFSANFSKNKYIPFLEAYSKAYGHNEYYEQVLRVLAMMDKGELKGLPLTGEDWYEIDDIQDLNIAETIFSEGKNKLAKFQNRYGGYWRFNSLIDFCYLVNPYFPSDRMKEELKANFDELLSQYPSGLFVNNLLASKYFGISQDYICVGNGAAELIKEIIQSCKGKIGVIFPTFEEYPNRAEKSSIESFIPANPDFKYNADDIISYFGSKDIQNLLLINPDNPSGNYIPFEDLLRIIDWTKKEQIRFIVDESFVDFSEEGMTLLSDDILRSNRHLLVVKSISKSYGVPGLRLGVVATSDDKLLTLIKKEVPIWNINSFAEFYLQIYGKYTSDYKKACKSFIQERERFKAELLKVKWLRVIPSQANYFLCEIKDNFISSSALTEKLLNDYSILIKDCGSKSAFEGERYIRIAVRDMKDNNTLVKALECLAK